MCVHRCLQKEEEMVTDFKLAENVFAKGSISSTERVCLWLGVCH